MSSGVIVSRGPSGERASAIPATTSPTLYGTRRRLVRMATSAATNSSRPSVGKSIAFNSASPWHLADVPAEQALFPHGDVTADAIASPPPFDRVDIGAASRAAMADNAADEAHQQSTHHARNPLARKTGAMSRPSMLCDFKDYLFMFIVCQLPVSMKVRYFSYPRTASSPFCLLNAA